ncbi:hypothetical protein [Micromonospora sp. NPDC047074]|uniref:hypothetical protein n=1 Tax=Micromonospora sp. NPDC047074 TaxID=3154339 RepID=UPI0034011240
MPAPVASADKRSLPLLAVLFWIGVALAPVAALILLVADGNGPLRFAAVLAIMAVVLIGLSIALRADGAGPARTEELLDEIEQLRHELRGEIAAAAQRGNQALDHAQRAQEAVTALRRRLDASSAALAGVDDSAGAGRARVPADGTGWDRTPGAQDEAAPRRRHADREDEEHTRRAQPAPRAERPAPGRAGGHDTESPAGGPPGRYAERPAAGAAGVYGAGRPAEPGSPPPARPVGMVRHTETVHVTTRHTIVDGTASVPGDRRGRYDDGYAERWSPAPEERPWPGGPDDRSRADHGYGDPADRPRHGDDRGRDGGHRRDDRARDGGHRRDDRGRGEAAGSGRAAPAGQPGDGRSYPAEEAGAEGDEYWSQLRAGDRWATVRDDDRGREMRVGERRAEVHSDATGTEYRVADRWAAVRRDEPNRGAARADDGWRGDWAEPADVPALPPGGVPVPDEWRPPRQRGRQPEPHHEPEPQRHDQHVGDFRQEQRQAGQRQDERYGYPPRDDGPRAGGTRSTDRWR